MQAKQKQVLSILSRAPVVPVLIVDDPADAVKLAAALVAGGLPAIEITLRTSSALDAIKAVSDSVPGAIAGAGTVLNGDHLEAARRAGAQFAVSPGATPALLDAADASSLPLLPGSATASEAMLLLHRGYRLQKFFPAEAAGGAAFLKSLASPLPDIMFCPTGGITAANATDYLTLDNVICVGGSWVAPKHLVQSRQWSEIEALARRAFPLNANRS